MQTYTKVHCVLLADKYALILQQQQFLYQTLQVVYDIIDVSISISKNEDKHQN